MTGAREREIGAVVHSQLQAAVALLALALMGCGEQATHQEAAFESMKARLTAADIEVIDTGRRVEFRRKNAKANLAKKPVPNGNSTFSGDVATRYYSGTFEHDEVVFPYSEVDRAGCFDILNFITSPLWLETGANGFPFYGVGAYCEWNGNTNDPSDLPTTTTIGSWFNSEPTPGTEQLFQDMIQAIASRGAYRGFQLNFKGIKKLEAYSQVQAWGGIDFATTFDSSTDGKTYQLQRDWRAATAPIDSHHLCSWWSWDCDPATMSTRSELLTYLDGFIAKGDGPALAAVTQGDFFLDLTLNATLRLDDGSTATTSHDGASRFCSDAEGVPCY